MFHVELRQFPNVARAFNLSREELDARILGSWLAARPVELDDHRYSPEKAKLTIYEGPRLAADQMGLGRSWANATRAGQDVTAQLLEQARAGQAPLGPRAVEELKLELVSRAADRPITPGEALALATARHPGRRVSEQLAAAEQAVWELLHQRRLTMERDRTELSADQWEAVLLARETWLAAGAGRIVLQRIPAR